MLRLLFRRWWLILIQGMLLIILSIFIFQNPAEVLAGISFWFGLIVFGAGLIGIITWLAADKTEKENTSLLWSIISFVFGLLILFNLMAAMKTITVIFGIWVLAAGFLLLQKGWVVKAYHSFGWIIAFAGILSVIAAFMIIFNIGTGAVAISTLLGLHVLFAGIALVLVALAKKTLVNKLKDKIESRDR